MSATNLFMNWTGVQAVTEGTSPVTVTLDKILDVEVDGKSVQVMFYGDNMSYPVVIRNTQKTRSITIKGGNVAKLLSIPEDVPVTITAVLNDVTNGTGSGAITIIAKHAKRENAPFSGQNNQMATASVTFHCTGDTGDTDPITITQAP